MKRKIYKLFSSAKQGLFALALTVLSGTAYSQAVYNFSYTGGPQTQLLPPGNYSIQCWGGRGGDGTTYSGPTSNILTGGAGGYSTGTYSVISATTMYIYVGGAGSNINTTTNPGGYNGGGNSSSAGYQAGSGGGASHVATATGILSSLVSNQTAVKIVAGGGGGGGNQSTPGEGGGVNGITPSTSTQFSSRTPGGGGTQTSGGACYSGGSGAVFGQGGTTTQNLAGGGGGGWYGGCTGDNSTAGGGGSGYIGGVVNGTTAALGQTGFLANPTSTLYGFVRITELCNISLYAFGNTNSLSPMICSGQSATLMTNAISNYSWSTGATTSSLVVSPTTNTVYSLSATSPSNCTTARSISINVSAALPVLSIANPSNNICLGRTVSLTATGALTYTWTNPGVVNGQTFTPSSTAVYTVSGQNGCGITVGTTTITVAPLPVTAAVSPTLVCEGFPATLTAVSAVTGYTWLPGPLTGATALIAPMVSSIYTVTASDGTCAGTATISVPTKPTPTITAATTSTMICQGESVVLTASGAGTGGSYNWTPGGAGSQITMSPVTSSLFAVSGTNSVNCSASAQQVVVVVAAPPMSVVANKTLVCIQSSAILTASGANSYTWTNGPFVGTYTVTPTTAITIYTVIGSHQTNTCLATRTIAIGALIPNVTVTSTTGICEGASATLIATGATTYSWNGINNGTSGIFQPTPSSTTIYNLIAFTTSANVNCPSYHTATVIVYANPTIAVTPAKPTICKGETHTLTATGAVNYTWSPTNGTGSVVTVKPNSSTLYEITGKDANGCENSTFYTAKVSSCVGITEMQDNQYISVYPNPSTGEFVVSTNSDIALKIVNSIGQQVRVLNLDAGNDHKAQVKDLSSGVYFIVGENAEGKVNQKIIITK